MMNDNNAWIEAVAKLIALTQANSLRWEECRKDELPQDTDTRKHVVGYSALFDQRPIRVIRRNVLERVKTTGFGKSSWVARSVLQLSPPQGGAWWSAPYVAPVEDLVGAVQYQQLGLEDFFSALRSVDP